MKVRMLLDTHVLVWSALEPWLIPNFCREMLSNPKNQLLYSVASLWEITVKAEAGHPLGIDSTALRAGLQRAGYEELPINAEHVLATATLPRLHEDPFDRILIAQAMVEMCTLVSGDAQILQYKQMASMSLG
jgi:PIN domain nuclease of toxin-antitoxin system